MCGRMLDPAHARETRTVDGQSVALCSATCARAFDRGVAPVVTIGGGEGAAARTKRRSTQAPSSWRAALAKAPPGAELEQPAAPAVPVSMPPAAPAVTATTPTKKMPAMIVDDDDDDDGEGEDEEEEEEEAPPPLVVRPPVLKPATGRAAGKPSTGGPVPSSRPGMTPVVADATTTRSGATRLPGLTSVVADATTTRAGAMRLPGMAPAPVVTSAPRPAASQPPPATAAPAVAPSGRGTKSIAVVPAPTAAPRAVMPTARPAAAPVTATSAATTTRPPPATTRSAPPVDDRLTEPMAAIDWDAEAARPAAARVPAPARTTTPTAPPSSGGPRPERSKAVRFVPSAPAVPVPVARAATPGVIEPDAEDTAVEAVPRSAIAAAAKAESVVSKAAAQKVMSGVIPVIDVAPDQRPTIETKSIILDDQSGDDEDEGAEEAE